MFFFTNQLLAPEAGWARAQCIAAKTNWFSTYANSTYVLLANTYSNNSARAKLLNKKGNIL